MLPPRTQSSTGSCGFCYQTVTATTATAGADGVCDEGSSSQLAMLISTAASSLSSPKAVCPGVLPAAAVHRLPARPLRFALSPPCWCTCCMLPGLARSRTLPCRECCWYGSTAASALKHALFCQYLCAPARLCAVWGHPCPHSLLLPSRKAAAALPEHCHVPACEAGAASFMTPAYLLPQQHLRGVCCCDDLGCRRQEEQAGREQQKAQEQGQARPANHHSQR